jgi:CxxC motif-containing protein (DUF1111 family)
MIRDRCACRAGFAYRPAWLVAVCCIVAACPIAMAGGRGARTKASPKDNHIGRDLFVKVWEPGQPSQAGGDGLGPLYNETSCVACHQLGGIGGGGRNEQNVTLLTAASGRGTGLSSGGSFKGELPNLHAGFRDVSSIVLHRHAVSPSDQARLEWIGTLSEINTRAATLNLRTSTRNTPAIFGAGLIDAIPDDVLYEAAKRKFAGWPEIQGRVSRLPDGRIGRFGWKAQTASLRDFALAACANELGLEVPGHHQARLEPPGKSETYEVALDMTEDECDELVEFMANLTPPVLRPVQKGWPEPWGYEVFEQTGCATCHTPQLGRVNGLYSDLLLHDMGPSSADLATYYGGSNVPGSSDNLAEAREKARAAGAPAIASEWRTPPLWGVAASGPYLHDGRASTLDIAIRQHGGEAAAMAQRYSKLPVGDRRLLLQFLHSLTLTQKSRKAAIDAIQARSHHKVTEGMPE